MGLIYMQGLLGANLISVRELWSGNYSPVFNAAMSINRFSYLLSMLRLDDITVRDESRRYLKPSVADPKLFIPDLDTTFQSSGSGSMLLFFCIFGI